MEKQKNLEKKIFNLNKKEDFLKLKPGQKVKYIAECTRGEIQTGVVADRSSEYLIITRRDTDSYGKKGILEHLFRLEGNKIVDYWRANNAFTPKDSLGKSEKEKYRAMNEFLKGYRL